MRSTRRQRDGQYMGQEAVNRPVNGEVNESVNVGVNAGSGLRLDSFLPLLCGARRLPKGAWWSLPRLDVSILHYRCGSFFGVANRCG